MKKEETKELEELSLKVFGKRYYYRKLRKKGLAINHEINDATGGIGRVVRRMPLSPQGARAYMEQTLEMRKQIKKEQEEKKSNVSDQPESVGVSIEGQVETGENNKGNSKSE